MNDFSRGVEKTTRRIDPHQQHRGIFGLGLLNRMADDLGSDGMDLAFDGYGYYARPSPLAKGGQREKPTQGPEFAKHLQGTFTISNLGVLVSAAL